MKRISAGGFLFLCFVLCVGCSSLAEKGNIQIEGKAAENLLTILYSANTLGALKGSG
jgi:hypothetical protein